MFTKNNKINFKNTDIILFGGCSKFKYQTIVISNYNYNSTIYISHDYGNTFDTCLIFPDKCIFKSNIFISNNGKYQTIPIYCNKLYSSVAISNNYGKTFNICKTSFPSKSNISFICGNKNGKYQYMSIYNGYIWSSSTYGNEWEKMECNIGGWSIISVDENNLYKICINLYDGYIYMCYPNRTIWTKTDINVNKFGQIKTLFIDTNKNIYINSILIEKYNINNEYQLINCSCNNKFKVLYKTNSFYINDNKLNSNIEDKEIKCIYISNCGEVCILISSNNLYIKNNGKNINKTEAIYNENSLFMRGDNFYLPKYFYIVGRSQLKSTYYYLTLENNNLLFEEFSSNINKTNLITLSLSATPIGILSTSSSNVIVDEDGIVNLSTTSKSNLNIFNLNKQKSTYIYAGLWYNIYYDVDQILWNIKNNDNVESLDIMFIPINDSKDSGKNSLAIWQDKKCVSYLDNDSYGLNLFYNWISNNSEAPKNCYGDVSVSSESNNCYFSNNNFCEGGYLYDLAAEGENCGKNLGICTNGSACNYDETIKEMSCNENNDNQDESSINLTLILIIFIIIFIIIIVVFIFLFSSKQKDE